MEYDVQDKRPISAAEALRGVEAVKKNWSAQDQAWLRELPADEAAVVLLLAGELGAVPVELPPRPERVIESTPTARVTDPPTSHMASMQVRMRAQGSKAALLLAHYDAGRDLTDEEAADLAGVSLSSEYATRCSELRNLGFLDETGREREGRAGMARMTSVITVAGEAYVREARWRTPAETLW